MIDIIQSENPILRQNSKEVPIQSIKEEKIQMVIEEMNEALDSQYDGVAIAAPQIAVSLRIFVVSGKVFDEKFMKGEITHNYKKHHENLVFINPVIKKISKDKKLMTEGCLSVRPIYGKVRRATRVTVEAYDKNGKKFIKEGTGLLAHIFQHEIDHLDGILFIDKAKDMHEVIDESITKN